MRWKVPGRYEGAVPAAGGPEKVSEGEEKGQGGSGEDVEDLPCPVTWFHLWLFSLGLAVTSWRVQVSSCFWDCL